MNQIPPHSERAVGSLIDLLRDRATGPCAQNGFTFFRSDDLDDEWLRYHRLDEVARCLAVNIRKLADDNPFGPHRAIVLAAPGASYLQALFGTLYAGFEVVTAYPPRARRRDERLDVVIEDSGATIALVDQAIFNRRQQILKSSPSLGQLQWLNVDALIQSESLEQEAGSWVPPLTRPEDIAVLQYTSGSTSDPKGVCLTHRNLLTNLRMIYEVFEVERCKDKWSVTWLPPYHDMGLIGGLFQVMYAGECTHVIPPAAFVQKPIRWLRAISKYRASVSGGPNFSYDICTQRISDEERDELDLSCWTLAFTGAEPVRTATLSRFAEAFAGNGFQKNSFFPCYGLAEATLMVSGGPRGRSPKTYEPPAEDAKPYGVGPFVSCGKIVGGQELRIVDPTSLQPKPPGTPGEIWVSGDNISPGYWEKPEATQSTFGLSLPGEEAEFLRTGDLGFIIDDELYVSGRLKELIIVRGRNFQPSDIEVAIEGCHDLLVPNASAAFEIDVGDESGLAIVHEIERHQGDEGVLDDVVSAIRQELFKSLSIQPHCVLLIPKRSLPKTSSGKVKRLETKRLFEEGDLNESALHQVRIAGSAGASENLTPPSKTPSDNPPVARSSDEIARWLVERLAKQMGVETGEISVRRPFSQYGLDSVSAVQIASELESYSGSPIPATLMYEAPTIEAVAARLSPPSLSPPQRPNGESERASVETDVKRRDMAIVGVACRLPGCDSVDEFWSLLAEGGTGISEPPADRIDCVSEKATTSRAGWIADIDQFDAALFGISPREASLMDPQHRLLLEAAWRAIEDSATDPRRLSGTDTGVFVGIANSDYSRRLARQQLSHSTYSMTGNAASMASHRLSYHLDLRGPSISIDTACSSSLVAVHQAIRAIQSGDCRSAIVAGVNLMLSHEVSETLSDAQMLSPDGCCRTFDAAANGYVRGEGCVAVVIKPLEDAIASCDPIRAVIRGSAVNQDGQTNGITAPNGKSQVSLYQSALADARIEPGRITRLETHGTGTPLGDPIEVDSLASIYGAGDAASDNCFLGAVKANVGHLEAAAGLAGLLKVVLELQHRQIAPQPLLNRINPIIDLQNSRLVLDPNGRPWDSNERVAAVSSFGFGGTNAHILLSEYSNPRPRFSDDESNAAKGVATEHAHLVTLSASHPNALKEVAASNAASLETTTNLIAFAGATRDQKSSHRHRLAFIERSAEKCAETLRHFANGEPDPRLRIGTSPTDRVPTVAFAFSGQGGQQLGMGKTLHDQSPCFRDIVERCDVLLQDEFGYRVGDVFTSDPPIGDGVGASLSGTVAQTSLFVLQLALAKSLECWGVVPKAVVGHSMGEYAAAVSAGVMPWQDALRLTAMRAKAIEALPSTGAMTVVFASLDFVEEAIEEFNESLSIAAIDAPQHIVVSGLADAIEQFESLMYEAGIVTRGLRIQHAFHSPLLGPVLPTIESAVASFKLRKPRCTYVSTLTGTEARDELLTPEYWSNHSRKPVQFVAGLDTLSRLECDLIVELGPQPTLCTLGQLNPKTELEFLPTLNRGSDAWEAILQSVAEMYVRGVPLQVDRVESAPSGSTRLRLPGYPFERRSYWIEESNTVSGNAASPQDHIDAKDLSDRVVARINHGDSKPTDPTHEISEDNLRNYADAMARVEELAKSAMRLALSELRGRFEAGDEISPDDLVAAGTIAERHLPLTRRICEILEDSGDLRKSMAGASAVWIATKNINTTTESFEAAIDSLRASSPLVRHELRLLQRCGRSLPRVLSGERDPLTVLFPEGDTGDLESLYRDSPLATCSNRLFAETASVLLSESSSANGPSQSPATVLEIGAGTGGTTAFVLPQIREAIDSYAFTDISPVLLEDSKQRFGGDPKIEFLRLDIEDDPESQPFEESSYDLVLAANVVHATTDLRRSLQNIRRLLRPGGSLIILEGTRREPFLDLVFGLTEGWWHFTDHETRTSYPLLEESRWIDLLEDCGFEAPAAIPYPERHSRVHECQSIILAHRDRQTGVPKTLNRKRGAKRSAPAPTVEEASARELENPIREFHAAAPEAKPLALESYMRASLSRILRQDGAEIDAEQPVNHLGIDSLMALQLKNRMQADLGLAIPMIAFLDGKSIRQLIEIALETSISAESDEDATLRSIPKGETQQETASPPTEFLNGGAVLGPLSEGQQALWLIHQRSPKSPAYNFAFAARTKQRLNTSALREACHALQQRHRALRTCYRMRDQRPVRFLVESFELPFRQIDCRGWTDERVKDWIRNDADRPFDLELGPVVRFAHLICDDGDAIAIAVHHIAADLWSMDILLQELSSDYAQAASKANAGMRWPNDSVEFDSYVHWERGLVDSDEGRRLWAYWRKKLEGAPQVLELPLTNTRPAAQTFNGNSHDWSLSTIALKKLRRIADEERTTLFTILLASYQTFLCRICQQDDLLVGTVAANRGQPEWEGVVGYLLNHLVLRGNFADSPTFRQVLRRTHRDVIEALEHQHFPFAKLVEGLRPTRDPSRTPLVQTMFIWDKPRTQMASEEGTASTRLTLEPMLIEQRGAPFDLTLVVFDLGDEMRLSFRYNTDLFSADTIATFAESFQRLIDTIADDRSIDIRSIPLLGDSQSQQLSTWNATDLDFDEQLSGYELFRRHVETTPEAIAIETPLSRLSYAEVDARATLLAHRLLQQGLNPGEVVGLLLPRSADAIIAILGIWKANGAYLPLDVEHPEQRLRTICNDARPVALITCRETADRLTSVRCARIPIDALVNGFSADSADECRTHDRNLPSYVIYTSGSTGKPKGVVLSRRGVANLAAAQQNTFGIRSSDRCLQFASLGFDASVFEIVMAFHAGATLVVLDQTVLRSSTTQIAEAIRDARITVATLPPTILAAMPESELPELRTLVSAGEACSAALVEKWGVSRKMFNAYGPTEATVWSSIQRCIPDGTSPSIGRPIANVRAEVLDQSLERLPIGVPGELCLSGPGLALGYNNMPAEAAVRFVPNPWSDRFDASLYRTGDRVRWSDAGELEFLGRIDDQVKINGHRIEPEEIACQLKTLSGVIDACVETAEIGHGSQLIAYVVPEGRSPYEFRLDDAKQQLEQRLPCYMMPSKFILVPELPLNASGKVDVGRLPRASWEHTTATRSRRTALTPTEKVLTEIWQQVLGHADFGVEDNFFDLGGASLQALQAADLANALGWALSAEQMFQFQTIAALAKLIDGNAIARATPEASSVSLASVDGVGNEFVSGAIAHTTPDSADALTGCVVAPVVDRSLLQDPASASQRMRIESLGMYLPPRAVTTDEIVGGCRNHLDFPLEEMTGISSRRMAGRDEFSIDLAQKAALDCLEHSRFEPEKIDLLLACNISRYDGPDFQVSYEPSTASRLKQLLGTSSAVAYDLCNACAGFFTALAVAESHLRTGKARTAMIVSGEYITHLTDTAQLEIDGFLDPRLACLTLGDAGIAMIVELGDDGGFETLDLYTAGRHHKLCVARASEESHSGAIMLTDPIRASAVTLQHSVPHAVQSIQARDWAFDEIRQVIMHQTSAKTIDGAIEELNRHFGETICSHSNTVNNLRDRGNTATTTHWVAVMDLIRQQRLHSGDRVVFAFSGSGQTIGTALYHFDDLPDRIRSNVPSNAGKNTNINPRRQTCGVAIVAVSVTPLPSEIDEVSSDSAGQVVVTNAAGAIRACLNESGWNAEEVDLLVHSGIYRDQFLSEPAIAAILAGTLGMNDGLPDESSNRTLAFDLGDGGRGSLTACGLVAAMIEDGRHSRAIVSASEIENAFGSGKPRGIAEMGSAIALTRIENPEMGLGEFFTRSYPAYADRLHTSTARTESGPVLVTNVGSDVHKVFTECIDDCVRQYLKQLGKAIDQFDQILFAVPSGIERKSLASRLRIDEERLMTPASGCPDAFTSSLATLWHETLQSTTNVAGQTWLIVSAGAGIEVSCVEYRHPQ